MIDDGFVNRAVIEALRNGDVKAFDIVYLTYKPHIRHFISKFINNPAIAGEITQDIFAHIWENREAIDPGLSLKRFIFVIARNRTESCWKRKKEL